MSSLRRQNTLYGFDTSLPGGFSNVSTISNGICTPSTNANLNNDSPSSRRSNSGCKSEHWDDANNSPHTESGQPLDRGFSIRRALQRGHKQNKRRCYSCGATTAHRKKDIKLRKLLILIGVFVIYVSVGAVVFKSLESGPERSRKESFENYIERFLERHPYVNRSEIHDLIEKSVVDGEIVFYVVNNKTYLDRWNFCGAFGFVVSVVTTIGFGNLSPFTMEGKLVCVVYAILGIPLTLMVLNGIGQKMAHYLTKIRKIRCALCHQTPVINKRINVIIIAVIGIILVFLLPAAIFSYVEQWHYLEALYFCFTTLSTVGFGDYVIGLHEKTISNSYTHEIYIVVGYIWILLGLSYLSLIYRIVMDTVVASARRMEQRTKQRLGPEYSDKAGNTLKNEPTKSNSNVTNTTAVSIAAASSNDACNTEDDGGGGLTDSREIWMDNNGGGDLRDAFREIPPDQMY